MIFRHALWPLLALILAACTQFPELENTVRPEVQEASYPELIPLEPILATVEASPVDPVQTEAALETRLASLRARANAMRGSVLSSQEKKRLDEGVDAP
ncbi:MAG: hypothetical protein HKN30_11035 [Sulfitobacter sp.]|nr:hypothetical protein [Sulfitobacter sp.]